ncbi:pyridoxamine 5'-phosphate oxidase family protein [Polaromonas sp.]|uniref:pyridoxamine 5'-phosphate oxidase family protein n=1 Tax=Polaromonas sp. TaxID=1869339 RepID=UPI00356648C1
MTSTPPRQDHETLWDLIKDIKFGMLTHRHGDGSLQSHPLTTQNQSIDENSTLYFFISKKGEMASSLGHDANVNVAYADTSDDNYVSIAGKATLSDDQATTERLFNTFTKAWFPGGVNDPDLQLVEVKITHAEYWNAKDSKVTQLFKMAKSAVTGDRPKDMSEHKEVPVS